MPNIIDSIQISGVTYTLSGGSGGGGNNVIELTQAEYDALVAKDPTAIYIITDAEEINANDYVTKASNAASGYSYDSLIPPGVTFKYDEQYRPTLTVKYLLGGFNGNGTYSIGNISVWISSSASASFSPRLQYSNGVLTGITNLSYATGTVEDGVAYITLNEGYYLRSVSISSSFAYFEVKNYSSGQSKSVIENTIYDVLNTVSDDTKDLLGLKLDRFSFNTTSDGSLVLYGYDANGNNLGNGSFKFFDGETINYDSDKGLYLTPIEGDYYWKKENLRSGSNYCQWPSNQFQTYADTFKKIRLKLNPSYTSNRSIQIRLYVGGVADKTQTYFNQRTNAYIYFDSINNTLDTNNVIGTYCISNITYDSSNNIIEITMDENSTYNNYYYGIVFVNQSNCWIGTNYFITEIYNYTNQHSPIEYIMENKQDKLSAGTGIDITDNVISVTGGGGGSSVTVDPSLDSGSTNPVANSAITEALYELKNDKLDASAYTPTDLSNYYTSAQTESAISAATSGKVDTTLFDSVMSIFDGHLYQKQNKLTAGDGISLSGDTISVSGMQPTLSAGTGIDITDNVISVTGGGGGGGAVYSAGTNIDITNDVISMTVPISAGTGINSVKQGMGNANGNFSHAEGVDTQANGNFSHAEGAEVIANGNYSHAEGLNTVANNIGEFASGWYNLSNSASTDSGTTIFSVGCGTSAQDRKNAFEIRRNGDIYIASGGTSILLQDNLGGGGTITVDTELSSTSTNPVQNKVIYQAIGDIESLLASI